MKYLFWDLVFGAFMLNLWIKWVLKNYCQNLAIIIHLYSKVGFSGLFNPQIDIEMRTKPRNNFHSLLNIVKYGIKMEIVSIIYLDFTLFLSNHISKFQYLTIIALGEYF